MQFYIIMALILQIETATEVCSVALADEKGVMDVRENKEGKSHAALLTQFMDEILKANQISSQQLNAVAVSSGPGSYTGLRIGVSAAKGLCYGAKIPLIAVSTLQSMALGFLQRVAEKSMQNDQQTWYCPMIDARRLEVYTAFFDSNASPESEISAQIIDENSFQEILSERKVIFFGNGSAKCKDIIRHPNAVFHDGFTPSATDMTKLANDLYTKNQFENVAYFEPFYLKDFIATIPKNKVLKNP